MINRFLAALLAVFLIAPAALADIAGKDATGATKNWHSYGNGAPGATAYTPYHLLSYDGQSLASFGSLTATATPTGWLNSLPFAQYHLTPLTLTDGQTAPLQVNASGYLLIAPTGTQTVSVSGTVPVSGTFWQATQPVSGTFWQTTQPVSLASIPINAAAATAVNQTTANTSLGSIDTKLSSQATAVLQGTGNTSLASIDGKITAVNTGAVVVSSSALPTGASQDSTLTGGTAKAILRGGAKGSTSAADVTSTASGSNHQPIDVVIYDTSGNAITSFGGSGGTSSSVGSAVPSTATAVGFSDGTNMQLGHVDGSGNLKTVQQGTVTVSGSVTSNIGTTNGLQLDATGAALNVAQGAAIGSNTGPMAQGSVTTAAPTYTTAKIDPLSLDTSGNLRVSLKDSPANTNKFLVTPDLPTGASTEATLAALNTKVTAVNTGAVTISAALPAGSNAIGSVILGANSGVDIGKLTANQSTNMAQVAGTTTDTNSGNKSAGTLRVVLATDQPALTNKLLVTPDSVALPANQSVNVSQINAVTPLMGNGTTGTGSQRVTIASDNTAFTVNAAQSGTWTVQPGNTANTTAWKVDNSAVTQPISIADATASGNITTQNLNPSSGTATAASTVGLTALNGKSTVTIQVTGTYTGALTPQVTTDNSNWIALDSVTNVNTRALSSTIASATVGVFQANVAGYTAFRMSANAAVTGTATVSVQATIGTSKDNYTKIYDGVNSVAIEQSGADGISNSSNRLRVSATPYLWNGTTWDRALEAAHGLNSAGTGVHTSQIVGEFDDTSPTSITENQFGNLRMSANRNLYGTIRDAAGNERGANVNSSNQLSVSVDAATTLTVASHAVTNAGTFAVQAASAGDVASGSSDSGNPVKQGYLAKTALPTAVSDAQRVNGMADKFGRQVVITGTIRDLVASQNTTITSSTAETTIVTAGAAGVFNDLTSLAITNSSATGTLVTLKDATSGTTRGVYYVPATGGIVLTYRDPKAQSGAAANWTLTCTSSVASIYVTAEFEQNK